MVNRIRLICQHISFAILIYGGRFGIHLGNSLPCFACPFVSGCGGHCYLMIMQRSHVGFRVTFDYLFSRAGLEVFWPFMLFLLLIIPGTVIRRIGIAGTPENINNPMIEDPTGNTYDVLQWVGSDSAAAAPIVRQLEGRQIHRPLPEFAAL